MSVMLRAPMVRLILIAAWLLAVLGAAATGGSRDADATAYPSLRSGAHR